MDQTFTLTITGTDHCEWQGRIGKANGEAQEFQSLLELVMIIDQQMEETK